MAILGVSPVRPRQKKDTMDKVTQALGIAQGVLGTALAIPKFIEERRAGRAAEERADRTFDITVGSKTTPIDPSKGEVEDPLLAKHGISGRVFKQPALKEPTSAFASERAAANRAFDAGLVFVNRGNQLLAIEPQDLKEGEQAISTPDQWVLENQNIKRKQSGQRVDLSFLSFTEGQKRKDRIEREDEVASVTKDFKRKVEDLDDEINKIASAPALLRSDSTIAEFGLGRVLAKGVFGESGRLTDQDVLQFIPSSLAGTAQKVANWFSGKPTGALTDKQQQAIQVMLKEMLKLKRVEKASRAYDTVSRLQTNSKLRDSVELDEAEQTLFRRHGNLDRLRKANQIKRARVLLATTSPGEQIRFDGEDTSWDELRMAVDAQQDAWLKGF